MSWRNEAPGKWIFSTPAQQAAYQTLLKGAKANAPQ
jgi:hypothetical protein